MRTWGRIAPNGATPSGWVEVQTAPDGTNDAVSLVWLAQVLQLNLGESPFFGDWGIPAYPSVVTQIYPDFYVNVTQARFAPYFASLLLTRVPSPTPTYHFDILTHSGTRLPAYPAELPT